MILTIDVGNTTTRFGEFQRGRLASQWTIPTRPTPTAARVRRQLRALPQHRRRTLQYASTIVLCSVVPRMSTALGQVLRSLSSAPIRIVGRDVRVPLKNRYARPRQVGQDRLVGAYAAWVAYGVPRGRDVIIVDFGTAITIDVVTKAGAYLGGVIAPGPEISLEALATRTALLPRVTLGRPSELLGRDTVTSIRSGILHGSAALCDGLIARLKPRYVPRAVVVATGGASRLIAPYSRQIRHIRPSLVLEGLWLLSALK